MELFEALLLGILQDITEWLPISSSAHLALAQYFFGMEADVAFDIVLHLGTLVAVLAYYRNDLTALARGVLGRKEKETRFSLLILLSAVPTAIIGLLFKDFFSSMFSNPLAIAGALAITGVFLLVASRTSGKSKIKTGDSLAIGIAQGIAVAPGISRSGATIGTALLLGVEREKTAKFSFLAAILPILGAALLEGKNAVIGNVELLPVAIGFLTAAIVGYFSIGLLIRFLKESKFQWFGYYCLALALIVAAIVL